VGEAGDRFNTRHFVRKNWSWENIIIFRVRITFNVNEHLMEFPFFIVTGINYFTRFISLGTDGGRHEGWI
jgi:hypothetical protein